MKKERGFEFSFDKSEINHHGTQAKGEPWNAQTVKGWKLKFINICRANSWNRELQKNLAFCWRWILYHPSGSCWYLDVAWRR